MRIRARPRPPPQTQSTHNTQQHAMPFTDIIHIQKQQDVIPCSPHDAGLTRRTARPERLSKAARLSKKVKGALQILSKRYRYIRFTHVPTRVSTKSFVVLMIGNSESSRIGARSTFYLRTHHCLFYTHCVGCMRDTSDEMEERRSFC